MSLSSYTFKPKHGHELAGKIIQRFCDDFLGYENEGFYLHWRTPQTTPSAYSDNAPRQLPEGYVEFDIETENGNMEAFSETCYNDEPLSGHDLTGSFFALLGDDFWEGDDGEKEYHFGDRDLAEIVAALSAEDSRIVSFGCGRSAWIGEHNAEGEVKFKVVDLLDYALSVPIFKESKPQNNQLVLSL